MDDRYEKTAINGKGIFQMITLVTCSNCGKDRGINFEFAITEWAKRCGKCGEQGCHEKSFKFCSLKCSKLYLIKLDNHRCSEHYVCEGAELDKTLKKVIKVWVACSICRKLEFIPYKKGMKIKGLKHYQM